MRMPRIFANSSSGALIALLVSLPLGAAVPAATITGPIPADAAGSGSRNSIDSASASELAAKGYVEEEYFIEGTAKN